MFTGIIEEIGTISSIRHGAKSVRLSISAMMICNDLKIGDSVAVNGVCLTAAQVANGIFTADVMNETLKRSNLGELTAGSPVNLERAMPADGRFGGHIVSGHIDGTGRIIRKIRDDNAVWVTISASADVMKYIAMKGSIAIDGISLTVADVADSSFSVSVIPHTGRATTLLEKTAGDSVNLENDILGKYVERFLYLSHKETKQNSGITMEFLTDAGF